MKPKKAPPSANERKNAFIRAKKLNTILTILLLSKITDRTSKKIEVFLYDENRSPSMWDIYLVWKFLNRGGHHIPIELNRMASLQISRVDKMAKELSSGNGATIHGERIQRVGEYIYNHQKMNAYAIAKIVNRSNTGIRRLIVRIGANIGDDITTEVNGMKRYNKMKK